VQAAPGVHAVAAELYLQPWSVIPSRRSARCSGTAPTGVRTSLSTVFVVMPGAGGTQRARLRMVRMVAGPSARLMRERGRDAHSGLRGSSALGHSVSPTARLWWAVFHLSGRDLIERCGWYASPLMVLVGSAGTVRPQLATDREAVTGGVHRVRLVLGSAHELYELS
jgi:hypothetical protein